MPCLSCFDYQLHYTTCGSPAWPSLLLLHGFLGNGQDFDKVLSVLSRHFFCIVPDLPGHGQTVTKPGYYSFESTAAALVDLLAHCGQRRSHLLGYSMGGRLALYLACEYPDWVDWLILESASPGLRTDAARQQRLQWEAAITQQLKTLSLEQFLTVWYRQPLFSSLHRNPERYGEMVQRRKVNQPEELIQALRGFSIARQPCLWERLKTLERPIGLLAGELDGKYVALSQEIYRTCQGSAHLRLFVDCGHNLHLETPERYTPTVIGLLRGMHLSKTTDIVPALPETTGQTSE